MSNTPKEEPLNELQTYWAHCRRRCFGDKGDVEDITEGSWAKVGRAHFLNVRPADIPKADIISTVEFDHTGNYLATGDKGGRVVLFERNETVSSTHSQRRGPSKGTQLIYL